MEIIPYLSVSPKRKQWHSHILIVKYIHTECNHKLQGLTKTGEHLHLLFLLSDLWGFAHSVTQLADKMLGYLSRCTNQLKSSCKLLPYTHRREDVGNARHPITAQVALRLPPLYDPSLQATLRNLLGVVMMGRFCRRSVTLLWQGSMPRFQPCSLVTLPVTQMLLVHPSVAGWWADGDAFQSPWTTVKSWDRLCLQTENTAQMFVYKCLSSLIP